MSATLDPLLDALLQRELGHVLRPWPGTLYGLVRRRARDAGEEPERWLAGLMSRRDRGTLRALVAAATVPHTSFFRHSEQFEYLRAGALRKIAAMRGGIVKIWSAGCATGEEAYSLAMCAQDCRVRAEILATDVSERAVAHAKAGRYRTKSAKALPGAHPSDGWVAPPQLARMIHFEVTSLASPDPAHGRGPFDLIFCRNVLIYFDTAEGLAVVERLFRNLRPDGALVVSPTEGVLRAKWARGGPGTPLGWFVPKPTRRSTAPAASSTLPPARTRDSTPSPIAPQVVTPEPRRAPPSLEHASRRLGSGDPAGAEEILSALLNESPQLGEGWFLLGEALLARGERAQAKVAFLRAAQTAESAQNVDAQTLSRAARRRANTC